MCNSYIFFADFCCKTWIVLFFSPNPRLSYFLNMFLIFHKSEPQRSSKHGSYKRKGVLLGRFSTWCVVSKQVSAYRNSLISEMSMKIEGNSPKIRR